MAGSRTELQTREKTARERKKSTLELHQEAISTLGQTAKDVLRQSTLRENEKTASSAKSRARIECKSLAEKQFIMDKESRMVTCSSGFGGGKSGFSTRRTRDPKLQNLIHPMRHSEQCFR